MMPQRCRQASSASTIQQEGRSKCGWPARASLLPGDVARFTAVVFGSGDFRTPTELRLLPPRMDPGDSLRLGPLNAIVTRVLAHPRLIELRFRVRSPGSGRGSRVMAGLSSTPTFANRWRFGIRGRASPVHRWRSSRRRRASSFDWAAIRSIRLRGAAFATVTHAAGISSTGDARPRRTVAVR